jgi:hypothetical protein
LVLVVQVLQPVKVLVEHFLLFLQYYPRVVELAVVN